MNPGSPNQINEELAMHLMTMYEAAIRLIVEHKAEVEFNLPVNFSVAGVVDLMVERAKECPIIMIILIEMQCAEVIFILHQAEKESDCEKYIVATKFLAPLFAASHATKNVNMVSDLLVMWYCKAHVE